MINPIHPNFRNHPASDLRQKIEYRALDSSAQPCISIVTPFFNTRAVFYETVRSVFNQTLQQWEWLIVNDGSTDPEALSILESMRCSDPRVRVIDHGENKGLSAARNTGFFNAKSEYILLLDSDDLIEPTTAEKWFWFLETHPEYAFVSSYMVCFGAREYLWHGGYPDREQNMQRNRITTICMVRKTVHQQVNGFDESNRLGLEDWEFWLRCASHGYWGTNIPEYLCWNRTRADHTDRWENLKEERIAAFQLELQARYPKLWEQGIPKIVSIADLELAFPEENLPCQNKLQKQKPVLLLISPWFVTGGAEQFNIDLIKQMIQYGWEVISISTAPSNNPWLYEFEALTPDTFAMYNFLPFAAYPRFIKYLIQSRQVDAILVASSREVYRLLPYIRSQFPDLPIIDFLHFVIPEWMKGGFTRLSILAQPYLDLTVVSSDHVRQWMIAEGAAPERVAVCTTNIDTTQWHPDLDKREEIRKQYRIDEATPVILYVARLEKQKQPLVFAQTMLQLKQNGVNFSALVAGDGSLQPDLTKFVTENQLTQEVQLLGSMSNQQVNDLMSGGDILFLPSENEGIALVFFEAMASGLVVVGADVGGQRELVNPESGVLIQRGDDEIGNYARVLTELIQDPLRREKMAQAARARVVNHFSLEKMGTRMIALIDQARQLNKCYPKTLQLEQLTSDITRQTIEYLSAFYEYRKVNEMLVQASMEYQNLNQKYQVLNQKYVKLLDDFIHPQMPSVPATTYFYFAFRALFYPVFRRIPGSDKSMVSKVKNKFKGWLGIRK
jgi:glycosyltransferase involved in cell wall biosynthesis/GT2 family glycosyltransferase